MEYICWPFSITVNRLRQILPSLSLTLCIAFVSFMGAEVLLSKQQLKSSDDGHKYDLVYQAGTVDCSSIFTRQAGDGEADSPDPDARSATRDLALLGITLHSQSLSVIALARQQQLSVVAVKSGSRTLLYRRLII